MRLLTLLREGGPDFTPAALANLVAWFAPDQCFSDDAGTSPCNVGDPVAVWKDRGANAYHLSQPSGASRPTLRQDASGKPYVEFNGTQHLHRAGLPVKAQPNSLGFAIRRSAGTTVFSGFTSTPGTSTTLSVLSGAYRFSCGTGLTGGAADANDRTLIALANGASSAIHADGAPVASGNASVNGLDELHLGALSAGGSGWIGRVYGGAVANSLLSAGQVAALHAYLRGLMP